MTTAPGPLTVDVRVLRQTVDALLDRVEQQHGRHVDVDVDYYWVVQLACAFGEDLHTPGERANDLTLGQVSDDIESVRQAHALSGDLEELNVGHDLEHAVGLLRALAWQDHPRRDMHR